MPETVRQFYTTKLDIKKVDPEKIREAERLAREIERDRARCVHAERVQEDREGEDQEELRRQKSGILKCDFEIDVMWLEPPRVKRISRVSSRKRRRSSRSRRRSSRRRMSRSRSRSRRSSSSMR